jgi:hypothetical protein
MVAVQYAKEVKVMEWEIEETPSAYVVPMIPRKSLVLNDSPIVCKFHLYNTAPKANNADDISTTAIYKEVETVSDEFIKDKQIDMARMDARNQVQAIANYKDNWDGYGAIRPLSECLGHALDLIDNSLIKLDYLSDIYPNPNGTVTLEWERDDDEIGIELGRSEFSYYARFGNYHSYNNRKQYDDAEEIGKFVEFVSFMG